MMNTIASGVINSVENEALAVTIIDQTEEMTVEAETIGRIGKSLKQFYFFGSRGNVQEKCI